MRATLLLLLGACGLSADKTPPADAKDTATGDPCNGHIITAPRRPSPHVPEGSAIEWSTNPPTSGPHYAVWAKWDRQFTALARGNWVHNLEHGGVVFAYRCDAGCDVAGTLARLVVALPDDPLCTAPIRHRAQVVADPLLPNDGDVAAVAWGTYYLGTCADEPALTKFYTDHVGRAPENFCLDGSAAYGGEAL